MSNSTDNYLKQAKAWVKSQEFSIKIDERNIAHLKKKIELERQLLKLEIADMKAKKVCLRSVKSEMNKYKRLSK